jgi:hypothetical protein
MKAYLFVDAENHFLRSSAAAEKTIGSPKAAQALSIPSMVIPGIWGFPEHMNGKRFGWDARLQLFWDCDLLSPEGLLNSLRLSIARAVYACSCMGDEDKAHDMRVQLRHYGFEPVVVRESKSLRTKRDAARENDGLIEKPKGCDIPLATRMVADAAANLYDVCLLFTSDGDFLPSVEAVRRMGKIVWVFGYADVLPTRSPYLNLPDRFVDLGAYLKHVWTDHRHVIEQALESLGETGLVNDPV